MKRIHENERNTPVVQRVGLELVFRWFDEPVAMRLPAVMFQVGLSGHGFKKNFFLFFKAVETGKLSGNETFDIKMTLEAPSAGINHCIEG